MLEVLSPAGSSDALIAAVQNGADAVYLGYGAFNARMNAKNFTEEQLRQCVSYCHIRGVKVYLTLNTLVLDRELKSAGQVITEARRAGVDAVWYRLSASAIDPANGTGHAHSRQHANGGSQSGNKATSRWNQPRSLGPGAQPKPDLRHLPRESHRSGGFCSWRAVHVLFRTMLYVRDDRTSQRQPRAMRPTLPHGLWL